MIVLDGSKGEGGGQIIRNAIVYAILLKKSLQIHSIRAKRSQPGLKAQHVKGLELAVQICGGTLMGATIGSTVLEYHPGNASDEKQNKIICDIETAGSICLLLQVALPCWIFTQRKQLLQYLELRGGTNADLAPQIDYLQQILLPTLSRHCFPLSTDEENNDNTTTTTSTILSMTIERRGYYPIGKGIVHCELNIGGMNHDDNCIKQEKKNKNAMVVVKDDNFIHPIILKERGDILSIHIQSFYAGTVPEWVAQKMSDAAYQHLLRHTTNTTLPRPTIRIIKHENAIGNACGIFIVAKTSTTCLFGASSLQKQQPQKKRRNNTHNKRETPAMVGQRAAQELLDNLVMNDTSTVDMWLQDQLILFMALAHGTSTIHTNCLTRHTQTAIDVATIMTGAKFQITKKSIVPDSRKRKIPDDKTSTHDYGKEDCIDGGHIITCIGIGLPLNRDEHEIQRIET